GCYPRLNLMREAHVGLHHVVFERLPSRELVSKRVLRRRRPHEVVVDALAVDRLAGGEQTRTDSVARGEPFAAFDPPIRGVTDRVQGSHTIGEPNTTEPVAKELAADHLMRVGFPEPGKDGQLRGVDDSPVEVRSFLMRLDAGNAVVGDQDVDVSL